MVPAWCEPHWKEHEHAPVQNNVHLYRNILQKSQNTSMKESKQWIKSSWVPIGLLQQWVTCRDIPVVTPKTMCNHNIISRNKKNRSKLVILQSFSVLCCIFRKWEHFQITKFKSLYGWRASLALQQLFPIRILLIFLRFELPPNFVFQCYWPQTWQFYLLFPALSISSIHKVLSIKLKGG